MRWTALVPFKAARSRKSRLSDRLSARERASLSDRLFDHVAGVLAASPAIGSCCLLADTRPPGWRGEWIADRGRGLNPELAEARAAIGAGPLLVLHADLPLIAPADIAALLDAAEETGCAIASDRHGSGTNALAIADGRSFAFRFGSDSFAQHIAQHAGSIAVERPGLALDVDTPADLDAAIAAGFDAPVSP